MKALVIRSNKKIEVIDKPKPEPNPDELLIKIKASALNKRDSFISKGLYPNIKYGSTLGSDGVGEVVEIGTQCDKYWLGKQVIINPNIAWGDNEVVQSENYHILGMPTDGTFAEYISVAQSRVHNTPSHLNMVEAAALPLAGLTAYRACFYHGKIAQDNNVLISGFGGGVAQYAFQFAQAVGAKVYITSGSQQKREKALELGAQEAYNYHDANWNKEALKSTGGFDVVIDSAGGDQINTFVRSMKAGGRIVFYGATNGLPTSLDLYRMFWNQVTLQGSTMGSDAEFEQMLALVSEYKITPIVDSIKPFNEILTAFKAIDEANRIGKIVIKL